MQKCFEQNVDIEKTQTLMKKCYVIIHLC